MLTTPVADSRKRRREAEPVRHAGGPHRWLRGGFSRLRRGWAESNRPVARPYLVLGNTRPCISMTDWPFAY